MANPLVFASERIRKPMAVIDMNLITAGRKQDEDSYDILRSKYIYRTGFFGGQVVYDHEMSIPKNIILRTSNKFHPEGIDIIPPFIIGSPGWKLFYELPLKKLTYVERELTKTQIKLAIMIESGPEITTPGQLKVILQEVLSVIQSLSESTQIKPKEIPTTPALPSLLGRE